MQNDSSPNIPAALPPAKPVVTPPPRAARTGCWLLVVILGVCLICSAIANFALLAGLFVSMGKSEVAGAADDEFPMFSEVWSYGDGDIKALRLTLNGMISRDIDGGLLGQGVDFTESLLRQIRAARHDEAVKAIILEVDSPGGVMTPTDEIYQALQEFRASDEERKVVVLVRDLAASGAYYIAMASDWIIAEPTAIIGSIGVIMQTLNWKALSDKIGVSDVTITAGKNKDLLDPFKDVKPEHLYIFQQILDEMHDRFVGIVQTRLALDDDVLEHLTDGRVFSANQAAECGMIDQVGYWNDVLARTHELLGTDAVRVVRYEQPRGLARFLARLSLPAVPAIRLPAELRTRHPRVLYLWTP